MKKGEYTIRAGKKGELEVVPDLPNNMVKSKGKQVKKPRAAPKKKVFGPVSTIDTAPVSIGNTIMGSKPVVVPVADGVRIKGRDFLIGLDSSATSVTGWTLVGACPITPVAMVASALSGFSRSYAQYRVHGVAFHYITAATTGDAGSVALYINKERANPSIPTSSANFLPLVLSDHNTCLSPIWKNSSALFFPPLRYYPTSLLNDEMLADQCPGELLVFARVTENVVPGYIICDYDITFKELSSNPKNTIFPITRMKYTQVTLSIANVSMTAGNANQFTITTDSLLDGTTTSSLPTGGTVGDVYKVICNVDDATFTTATAANLLAEQYLGSTITQNITLTDGFTMYGVLVSSTKISFYPNLPAAYANGSTSLVWQTTQTGTVKMFSYWSLVGSVFNTTQQANI